MSNSYFQFKQFIIHQDKSSLKVCTDSCLFGAWLADKLERKIIEPNNILDIGTGTGLLSLMLAQKSPAKIDAVEIDENSFLQSKENFEKSQWDIRLKAFQADIKNWEPAKKYDLIICNPPFYENDLRSFNQKKNMAKHNDALTLKDLIPLIKFNIADNGNFAVLLPFHRIVLFKKLALENDLYLIGELLVKQTPKHNWFRGILLFGTQKASKNSNILCIKDESGNYTKEFIFLLKDYYL